MKSSAGSYLLSLASAVAGAIIGAMLVAVPFVMRHFQHPDERVHFFVKWLVPFIFGFAAVYGLVDWIVRRKYLAIRRWRREFF